MAWARANLPANLNASYFADLVGYRMVHGAGGFRGWEGARGGRMEREGGCRGQADSGVGGLQECCAHINASYFADLVEIRVEQSR